MMRGTFANIRIRNKMTPDIEGGVTKHFPSGQVMSIYDAAMQYQTEGRPLVIFAGKEYGTGSSRDWAAKGTKLLGVRAVFAETYERIHRSNLVGMGVLPLQFQVEGWQRLGLTGEEVITIRGLSDLSPRKTLMVELFRPSDHKVARFPVTCRIDTETELEYFKAGGVMQYVLRNLARPAPEPVVEAPKVEAQQQDAPIHDTFEHDTVEHDVGEHDVGEHDVGEQSAAGFEVVEHAAPEHAPSEPALETTPVEAPPVETGVSETNILEMPFEPDLITQHHAEPTDAAE
jgi:hypothetical protein